MLPSLQAGIEYFQVQITLPEDKSVGVIRGLNDLAKPITKIHTMLSFLLICRVHRSNMVAVLTELDKLGIGTKIGIVEVLPIFFTMPQFLNDLIREEKRTQIQQARRKPTESQPKLEHIFSDAPNGPEKPAPALSTVFDNSSGVKRTLGGLWELNLANKLVPEHAPAPPPVPVAAPSEPQVNKQKPKHKKSKSRTQNGDPTPKRKTKTKTSSNAIKPPQSKPKNEPEAELNFSMEVDDGESEDGDVDLVIEMDDDSHE